MTTARVQTPNSADEVTMLRSFLDHYRATIRRQTEDLSAEQLAQRLEPSTMTLGGLLKHLALVEDSWLSSRLLGRAPMDWYADVDWDADPDWEWHSAASDSPEQLLAWYDAAIAQSDANLETALADDGLDRLADQPARRGRVSLRWTLVHLIEEYARHAGHADLIRESIDGTTDL